ncbi:MAG: SDR family oxidoreductase [Deltaproteobacteria bacterium]|nr:SDR family oxidoreductase [Deltaproteobacteria bacterium]
MNRDWSSFGLEDQIAIVTGASQGIGRTLAIALAQAGADVALVSRTRSDLEVVAKEIEAVGRKALVISADLQDVSQIRKLIDAVHKTFGKIDILINNAAWTATVEALEATEDEWDQTLDTSLKAIFFASQAAAKIMIQQDRGKIVNIGSTLGRTAFARRSVYGAAKAGVHHLTRVLALEWASKGISVNAVAPCITETPTRRELFERPGYKEWATGQMLPIGRWAQPEDLIGATLFLCSSLSDMVVGHVLMVDGGWTIH